MFPCILTKKDLVIELVNVKKILVFSVSTFYIASVQFLYFSDATTTSYIQL